LTEVAAELRVNWDMSDVAVERLLVAVDARQEHVVAELPALLQRLEGAHDDRVATEHDLDIAVRLQCAHHRVEARGRADVGDR